MTRRVPIARVDQVLPGQPNRLEIEGIGAIAVYCVDGCYHATSDECTHSVASLGTDGTLEGFTVECSWHGGKFDIRTGAPMGPPCTEPLKVYPLTVEGPTLFVTVDD
jgi:nitrite reductase/ring-hydroxylating ferredoxin subunit